MAAPGRKKLIQTKTWKVLDTWQPKVIAESYLI